MKGYKVLLKGLINRYGYTYELNKKYVLNGELKWRKNCFHFCTYHLLLIDGHYPVVRK